MVANGPKLCIERFLEAIGGLSISISFESCRNLPCSSRKTSFLVRTTVVSDELASADEFTVSRLGTQVKEFCCDQVCVAVYSSHSISQMLLSKGITFRLLLHFKVKVTGRIIRRSNELSGGE